MLPKENRLNLKKDFSFVASGKKAETPSLKLFFRTAENTHPLVGIALAKKNFRKAHERNKAKRVASSAISILYPNLKLNLNLVIMPKREILNRNIEEIKGELENVTGLYRND